MDAGAEPRPFPSGTALVVAPGMGGSAIASVHRGCRKTSDTSSRS